MDNCYYTSYYDVIVSGKIPIFGGGDDDDDDDDDDDK